MEVTIGGNRLGSGNKNKVHLRNYERSTHDLSYVWRSTMAAGTLVPFMTEVGLPGDTFDIELNCDVLTHPTIGPLFGSYKIQLDVFQIPIRLYQGKLHMNMLGIGMDMSQIKLPQLEIIANKIDITKNIDNQQINPSCILSYLGIRGIGDVQGNPTGVRYFNAIPYLAYWDIYKNYYANKQEEIGYVIHKEVAPSPITITSAEIGNSLPPITLTLIPVEPIVYQYTTISPETNIIITYTGDAQNIILNKILVQAIRPGEPRGYIYSVDELFKNWEINEETNTIYGTIPNTENYASFGFGAIGVDPNEEVPINEDIEPQLLNFDLKNIDEMRELILQSTSNGNPFIIGEANNHPYDWPFHKISKPDGTANIAMQYNQEGLAIKTYNSDLFNNWISTEWIDGTDGISAITAIDTSEGNFTIDELNLSKKIYDMLNRIALSGGSYDDWLDAVYTHERRKSIESPMYVGGLIKDLVFQEVISNASGINKETQSIQPLGTLAGRGKVGRKHKGGKTIIKIDEPSYIMGIISLTPNIDYSQGNKWDTNLKTMNDFHKPALDEIGFQDLITDQMAWWDTRLQYNAGIWTETYKSAGKQPAWINYMTNVNVVRGNFADQTQQMFMVLNRRYEISATTNSATIRDLTTYVDPSKFNHIFANTRLDAQNFWAQIGVNIEARRKMSAKIIPNL